MYVKTSSFIDHIYYINLDKDADRRRDILQEIDKIGINLSIERIEGILYAKTGCPPELQKYLGATSSFISKSALGCGLSHIKAWKRIIENNDKYGLILEDDAVIRDDFHQVMKEWYKEIPEDFDIVFTGCYMGCNPDKKYEGSYSFVKLTNLDNVKKVEYISKNLFIPALPLALHGYIVSTKGAQKLLEYFEKDKLQGHIDAQMLKYYKHMNIYALNEKLIEQKYTTAESSNNTYKYPSLLSYLISRLIPKTGPMDPSYGLSISTYEIFNVGLNGWLGIAFIIGLLFKDLKSLSGVFFIYNILETVYSKKIHLNHILIYYVVMLAALLARRTLFR
jgi:GR25 family glycosyltransferase involved in LPS biosynthesis